LFGRKTTRRTPTNANQRQPTSMNWAFVRWRSLNRCLFWSQVVSKTERLLRLIFLLRPIFVVGSPGQRSNFRDVTASSSFMDRRHLVST
jgi:hypothetical protein